jgi:hypothetical protein
MRLLVVVKLENLTAFGALDLGREGETFRSLCEEARNRKNPMVRGSVS